MLSNSWQEQLLQHCRIDSHETTEHVQRQDESTSTQHKPKNCILCSLVSCHARCFENKFTPNGSRKPRPGKKETIPPHPLAQASTGIDYTANKKPASDSQPAEERMFVNDYICLATSCIQLFCSEQSKGNPSQAMLGNHRYFTAITC